jgi:ABC-2 type transport system permease protein
VNGLAAAISTEFLKTRHSKVPWAVAAGFSLGPLVGGLLMVILKDPEGARQLGLIGTKAQLTAGVADWPTYLALLAQAVAVGGGVVFAFLTAWVFGREFADRTIRGLLAIPTTRSAIVVAKLVVIATWCVCVCAWVLVLGVAIGNLIVLPGWSTDLALSATSTIALVTGLTIALQTTTAFVAGLGRGYIAPLAWTVATVFFAQILSVLGWGAWFPWAVPAIVSGVAGRQGESATLASFVVVGAASVVGFAATLTWWRRADQTG